MRSTRGSIWIAAALTCVLAACSAGGPVGAEFDPQAARAWVDRLAADELGGRRSGTPDGDRAAEIIAAAFGEAGLQPAGDDGSFLHRFSFPSGRFVEPIRMSLSAGGDETENELIWGRDFYLLAGSGPTSGEAEIVFVGYGISAPELDELAGVDVEGKVLLALQGLPPTPRLDRSSAANRNKARAAKERGAAGILFVSDPEQGSSFPESRIWGLRPENYFPDFFLAKIDVPVAERLLDGQAVPLKRQLDTGGAAVSRPTGKRVTWEVTVDYRQDAEAANVLGVLPGADPELRDELVLVGAHYDGGGRDPDGTIYNGAEDNASGTAVVLELARTMAAGPDRSARTVMFAAWGAEEQGAWGSTRFLEQEVWPIDDIVFTLTFDNVGVGDGRFRLFSAHNFPAEYEMVRAAVDESTRERFTPRGAGGSDGWQFQIRGIPALFAHADAPQPWVHFPEDDAATISAEMLGVVGRFGRQALLAAGNAPPGAFETEGRLARYLARYAFVVGTATPESVASLDAERLREAGYDLILIAAADEDAAAALAARLPEGLVPVNEAADLSNTEAGQPVRALVVTADRLRLDEIATVLVDDPEAAAHRVAQTEAPTAGAGPEAGAGAESRAQAGSPPVALLLTADGGIRPEELVLHMLAAGIDPDRIQQLIGGRLHAHLMRVLEER